MRVRKAFLALATSSFLVWTAPELWAGGTIEEKPAFAPADSFQAKAVNISKSFRTADGSVHPAGLYSFKVQGMGKAGQVAIWVQNPQGKTVGKLLGQFKSLGGPDTKGSRRGSPNFVALGLSAASQVQFSPRAGSFFIIIVGGKGSIEALVPAVKN